MERTDKIGLGLVYIGLLIITLIGIASAETIYAGECRSIEFPNPDPVNWSVEGNSSDMIGFSFNKTGTMITYCFDRLYKPDNFTLTFYNYQEVIVDDSPKSSGGGGGSCRYDKNFDWNCTEWTDCIEENQTRTCKKYNNCRTNFGKPDETRDCTTIVTNQTEVIKIEPIEEPKIKWYVRLWEWIKSIFS